jgi:hypothetical protein
MPSNRAPFSPVAVVFLSTDIALSHVPITALYEALSRLSPTYRERRRRPCAYCLAAAATVPVSDEAAQSARQDDGVNEGSRYR